MPKLLQRTKYLKREIKTFEIRNRWIASALSNNKLANFSQILGKVTAF